MPVFRAGDHMYVHGCTQNSTTCLYVHARSLPTQLHTLEMMDTCDLPNALDGYGSLETSKYLSGVAAAQAASSPFC